MKGREFPQLLNERVDCCVFFWLLVKHDPAGKTLEYRVTQHIQEPVLLCLIFHVETLHEADVSTILFTLCIHFCTADTERVEAILYL